jgi:hypothetical protein
MENNLLKGMVMGFLDNDGNYYEGDRQGNDLEVANRPSTHHTYLNGQWVLNTQSLKNEKLMKFRVSFELAMFQITSGYPQHEITSWAKQEEEAKGFLVNPVYPTPLLEALATSRGLDKTELANRILSKASLYASLSGQIIGRRQALEDQLNALPSEAPQEDIEAIVW